jgi:hypothetical protein
MLRGLENRFLTTTQISHGMRRACADLLPELFTINIHNPNNAALCSPLATRHSVSPSRQDNWKKWMDHVALGSKGNVPAAPVTICHDQRRQFASTNMRCHECDVTIEILMRSDAVSHMRQEYHWISAILLDEGESGSGVLAELIPLVADSTSFIRQVPPWRSSNSPLCTSVRNKWIQSGNGLTPVALFRPSSLGTASSRKSFAGLATWSRDYQQFPGFSTAVTVRAVGHDWPSNQVRRKRVGLSLLARRELGARSCFSICRESFSPAKSSLNIFRSIFYLSLPTLFFGCIRGRHILYRCCSHRKSFFFAQTPLLL